MLRKVLRQIDIIKSSRSGTPNFEAHEVEANDLQAALVQYLQFRGTGKVLSLLLLLKLEFFNNGLTFPICLEWLVILLFKTSNSMALHILEVVCSTCRVTAPFCAFA